MMDIKCPVCGSQNMIQKTKSSRPPERIPIGGHWHTRTWNCGSYCGDCGTDSHFDCEPEPRKEG